VIASGKTLGEAEHAARAFERALGIETVAV